MNVSGELRAGWPAIAHRRQVDVDSHIETEGGFARLAIADLEIAAVTLGRRHHSSGVAVEFQREWDRHWHVCATQQQAVFREVAALRSEQETGPERGRGCCAFSRK